MAGPKTDPSWFCRSDIFMGPFFIKSSSLLSGNPSRRDSNPFFPRLKLTFLVSSTTVSFLSFNHSIPRLTWSGESFVNFSSFSGVNFDSVFNAAIIFFSIS